MEKKREVKEIKGTLEYSIKFDEDGDIAFRIDNLTKDNINECYFIALSMCAKEIISILESPIAKAMPADIEEDFKNALMIIDDLRRVKVKKLEIDHGYMAKPEADDLIKVIKDALQKSLGIEGADIKAFEIGSDGLAPMNLKELADKIKQQLEDNKEKRGSKEEKKDEDSTGNDEIVI